MDKKQYVVGFLFVDVSLVLLLRKRPGPYYVSGRWNGVGGKIEPGETPYEAMVREAREEANIQLPEGVQWHQFHHEHHLNIHGSAQGESDLFFFLASLTTEQTRRTPTIVASDPDEPLRFAPLGRSGQVNMYEWPGFRTDGGPGGLVPNLSYLVPMAVHWITHPNERYLRG